MKINLLKSRAQKRFFALLFSLPLLSFCVAGPLTAPGILFAERKSDAQKARKPDIYYDIDDSSRDFATYVADAEKKQAEVIRVGIDQSSLGSAVIGRNVKQIIGWQLRDMLHDEGEVMRKIGYRDQGTVRFVAGSHASISSLDFFKDGAYPGAKVVIDKGAEERFVNCRFSNPPLNDGTAIFEDCVFVCGSITNNGSASYIGTTREPKNLGTSGGGHVPLSLIVRPKTLEDAIINQPYSKKLLCTVGGSAGAQAVLRAAVEPADAGLSVKVEQNQVTLEGKPTKAGTYRLQIDAAAGEGSKNESAHVDLNLAVRESLSIELRGKLSAYTVKNGRANADAVSSATGGGAAGESSLKVFVKEGNAQAVTYNEFAERCPEAGLTVNISPNDSGFKGTYLYDGIILEGEPKKAGVYKLTATVREGARTAVSRAVDLRIYEEGQTLAERLTALPSGIESWDFEPYTIARSGNAVLPVSLKHIYGSHTSGTYAVLGNADAAQYASDTLTIPSGAVVTLTNMKIDRSVKLIVERGAKLTLDDSVAFGPIEVRGGTFSMGNGAAITNALRLLDGSRLENANIVSHARLLKDGEKPAPDTPTVVQIEGRVQVSGKNTITGEAGDSSKSGQTALMVKDGALILEKGASLSAQGGGDIAYAPQGGTAIVLENGKIIGHGTLIARGGHGYEGDGGTGIAGKGIVDVDSLTVLGGDAKSLFNHPGKGGAAFEPGVKVRALKIKAEGGAGAVRGSSQIYPLKDQPKPTDPTPTGRPTESSVVKPTDPTPTSRPTESSVVKPTDPTPTGRPTESSVVKPTDPTPTGRPAESSVVKPTDARKINLPHTGESSQTVGPALLLISLAGLAAFIHIIGRRNE